MVAAKGLPHVQNPCQLWVIAFGIINVDTRGGPVLSWGALCFDPGGGGCPVLIIVVPTSVHKRVNLDPIYAKLT